DRNESDVRATRPKVSKLTVGATYEPTGGGDTPSRRTIFVSRPARAGEEPACARSILTALAHRAFRRPVTNADIQPLYTFYLKGRADGDFETGIQAAIKAML